MKQISCIIPAYNEEKNIENILSAVVPLIGRDLLEVVVVDDASRDSTSLCVQKFPQVKLVKHEFNTGKSQAVVDGIRAAAGDYIFLLDADLLFVSTQNIVDFIKPVSEGRADVCLTFIKNSWPLFPFKKIDYLTGQRLFPKMYVADSLERMKNLRYGLEVFLNRIFIRNKPRLAVVAWPNVENVFNQHKYGWVKGSRVILKIWWNVVREVGIWGMYYQNIQLRKLLIED